VTAATHKPRLPMAADPYEAAAGKGRLSNVRLPPLVSTVLVTTRRTFPQVLREPRKGHERPAAAHVHVDGFFFIY